MTAELHWFPFFCRDWLSSPARAAMLPEQRGAYIDLLAYAWGNGSEPPSLDADDVKLASLSGLGARWKKLGPLIRAQFTESEGRLYNAKLTEVWDAQQTKYERRAVAGKKGGEGKAKRKQRHSIASELLVADDKHTESEEAVEASTKLLPASAPVGALALEGARAPAPTDEENRLHGEYFERLKVRVDAWIAKNPDDAASLETEIRAEMGLNDRLKPLSTFAKDALRERVLHEVRTRQKWPDSETWVAEQLAAKRATPAVGNADRAANDVDEAA